jgi:hypothetical protein
LTSSTAAAPQFAQHISTSLTLLIISAPPFSKNILLLSGVENRVSVERGHAVVLFEHRPTNLVLCWLLVDILRVEVGASRKLIEEGRDEKKEENEES